MKSYHNHLVAGNSGQYGSTWIKAAAILVNNSRLLTGTRHALIIKDDIQYRQLMGLTNKQNYSLQGFVLNDGSFVSRERARNIARQNGQLPIDWQSHTLFSEDLWNL